MPGKVYDISVVLSPRLRAVFEVNDIRSDFGGRIAAGSAVIIACLIWLVTLWL